MSEIEKSAADLLAVALAAIQRRALDEAKTIAEAAAVFAHSASLPGLEAHAHKLVGRVHHERDDFDASRRHFLASATVGMGGLSLLSGCGGAADATTSGNLNIVPAGAMSDGPEVRELKMGIIRWL